MLTIIIILTFLPFVKGIWNFFDTFFFFSKTHEGYKKALPFFVRECRKINICARFADGKERKQGEFQVFRSA